MLRNSGVTLSTRGKYWLAIKASEVILWGELSVTEDLRVTKWDSTITHSITIICFTKIHPRHSTASNIRRQIPQTIMTTTRSPVTINSLQRRLRFSDRRTNDTPAPRACQKPASSQRLRRVKSPKFRILTQFHWKNFSRLFTTLPITFKNWIKCARRKTRKSSTKAYRVSNLEAFNLAVPEPSLSSYNLHETMKTNLTTSLPQKTLITSSRLRRHAGSPANPRRNESHEFFFRNRKSWSWREGSSCRSICLRPNERP